MRTFHGLLGGGVLAFWGDVDAEHEEQFNEWYTHEHLPERVSIPGFLRGRRYEATEKPPAAGQRFFTLYETESVNTLTSDPYLERLNNPTELTAATVPLLKNMGRAVFRVVTTLGQGVGGFMGSLQLPASVHDGRRSTQDNLVGVVLPRLLEHREVTAAYLCEADVATTEAKDATAEGQAAGANIEPPRWLLMTETTHERTLDAVEEVLRSDDLITAAADRPSVARYRLMLSLSAEDAGL